MNTTPCSENPMLYIFNVFNFHHTGHMHGVFPVHIRMRARLMQNLIAIFGLVQKQTAMIVDIVVHFPDHACYNQKQNADRDSYNSFWLQDIFVKSNH